LATCKAEIEKTVTALIRVFEQGGKLLLCGNGGSATACEHMAGELMKGFLKKRPIDTALAAAMKENCPTLGTDVMVKLQKGLPAVALSSQTALITAFANDVDAALSFAQGVMALGAKGDALLALSTSGNSKNVLYAARVAKALGLTVIALTGKDGGELFTVADVCISVPADVTYLAQELHLPICHCLCECVEAHFFEE
jgi:D-sedoheptulose 7-phosphate isomerase